MPEPTSDDARPGGVLAVIPARGGSKGVPGKNLVHVGGTPLVVRAVRACRAAPSVDRVIVSTDADAIAEAARAAGADVVERPAELSGDGATSESALLHVLDELERRGEPTPDTLAFVQCTSPFTRPRDVDATVSLVAAGEADCAFTAAPFHGFVWRPGDDGVRGVNHDASTRERRQDRPDEYVETGAVYAMRVEGFRKAGHRFFGRIAVHEVPAERALEIDDPGDVELAEALATQLDHADAASRLPTAIDAVVFDFDGVFTDNRVFLSEEGVESVALDRRDGMGVELLRGRGVPMLVLSREENPVVAERCRKLQLPVIHGERDKGPTLRAYLDEHDLDPASTVYVGNDVNDLPCFEVAGCSVAPSDAHPEVLRSADLVLAQRGGNGFVRALCDIIITHITGDDDNGHDPNR